MSRDQSCTRYGWVILRAMSLRSMSLHSMLRRLWTIESVPCCLIFGIVMSLPSAVGAETIIVPVDYTTIQDAIDAAEDGDVIELEPDTYVETIDFLGKAITVRGTFGAAETIIDGDDDGSVVTFDSDEGNDSILEDVTITGGDGTNIASFGTLPVGGGIYIDEASPTIRNCIVEENTVSGAVAIGGGIYIHYGSPVIEDNIIRDNSALGDFGAGGGIGIEAGSLASVVAAPLLTRNHIIGNTASKNGGGIVSTINTEPAIRFNLILDNEGERGGGISLGGEGEIINNTIYGNTADGDSGGLFCGESVIVINCIIWGNEAPTDPQITELFEVDVTYSVIEDLPAAYEDLDGNLEDDPLFNDPTIGDFGLEEESPCIDAGDPESPQDPDLSTADIGALPELIFQFRRGDVDGNGAVTPLLDALSLLFWAFGAGDPPPCDDGADVDDNGVLSALVDSIVLLEWQFLAGDAPADPGADDCGEDPTADDLECETPPACD